MTSSPTLPPNLIAISPQGNATVADVNNPLTYDLAYALIVPAFGVWFFMNAWQSGKATFGTLTNDNYTWDQRRFDLFCKVVFVYALAIFFLAFGDGRYVELLNATWYNSGLYPLKAPPLYIYSPRDVFNFSWSGITLVSVLSSTTGYFFNWAKSYDKEWKLNGTRKYTRGRQVIQTVEKRQINGETFNVMVNTTENFFLFYVPFMCSLATILLTGCMAYTQKDVMNYSVIMMNISASVAIAAGLLWTVGTKAYWSKYPVFYLEDDILSNPESITYKQGFIRGLIPSIDVPIELLGAALVATELSCLRAIYGDNVRPVLATFIVTIIPWMIASTSGNGRFLQLRNSFGFVFYTAIYFYPVNPPTLAQQLNMGATNPVYIAMQQNATDNALMLVNSNYTGLIDNEATDTMGFAVGSIVLAMLYFVVNVYFSWGKDDIFNGKDQ